MWIEFLIQNHLQGYAPAKYHFGLYSNNELLMVGSFSNNRKFLKHSGWELVRMATRLDRAVTGGTSKLLHNAAKILNIQELYSYVDLDTFSGRGYESVGFELQKVTSPGYFYVSTDLLTRKHRYSFTRHALTKLGFSPEEHVDSITTKLKYYKVYNSGNLLYRKLYKHQ